MSTVKSLLIYALLFCSALSVAQNQLLYDKKDSINLNFQTNGFLLDSIDLANGFDEQLRPGSFYLQELNLIDLLAIQPDLGNESSGINYLGRNYKSRFLITPLPYLGVQYSFGTNLTQHLNLQYAQKLSSKSHLNLRYKRDAGNGFLTNSKYGFDDVNALYQYRSKKYANFLDASYSKYDWQENGGITTDTLLDEFALIFTPVNKPNANTLVKKADIKLNQFINFTNDSILKTGLVVKQRYEVINRVYTEQADSLAQFYEQINIDSSTTRDQYQTASIKNSAGYFFASKYFEIDALVGHRYWRNQNLGVNRDTNEVFLSSTLFVGGKNFNFKNDFYFNLVGATGEIKNNAKLYLNWKGFRINGNLGFYNVLPTPYQRFHTANNYNWKLTSFEAQQQLQFGGRISYEQKHLIFASLQSLTTNNGLYFIDNTWRQDTLDVVALTQFTFGGKLNWNKIKLYPTATLRLNSNNYNYQPTFSTRTRFSYSTGVFKANRLKVALGLDVGYDSEYRVLTYNPALSLFEQNSINPLSGNLFSVDAFFNAEIKEFRFFARAQNIDYFWNPSTTRVDPNFPIMPFMIKIGVSWDFFN